MVRTNMGVTRWRKDGGDGKDVREDESGLQWKKQKKRKLIASINFEYPRRGAKTQII
jgi:hypothetical protein